MVGTSRQPLDNFPSQKLYRSPLYDYIVETYRSHFIRYEFSASFTPFTCRLEHNLPILIDKELLPVGNRTQRPAGEPNLGVFPPGIILLLHPQRLALEKMPRNLSHHVRAVAVSLCIVRPEVNRTRRKRAHAAVDPNLQALSACVPEGKRRRPMKRQRSNISAENGITPCARGRIRLAFHPLAHSTAVALASTSSY